MSEYIPFKNMTCLFEFSELSSIRLTLQLHYIVSTGLIRMLLLPVLHLPVNFTERLLHYIIIVFQTITL